MQSILAHDGIFFKELEDCIQQGKFTDVDTEMPPGEIKLCDMDDILKGIQTLMMKKMLETNEANDTFLLQKEG